MPRRFVHAADLHLDSPFVGVGALRPGLTEALLDAALRAWDDLVELCIAEKAEFLLLAGDVFDSESRTSRCEYRLQRGVRTLVENGIRVYVAHGNHDPHSSRSPFSGIDDDVVVMRKDEPITKRIPGDGVADVYVHGVSHGSRRVDDRLATRFPERGDRPGLHIGLLHCSVEGASGHGRYAPCTLDELRKPGYDYWALGHIHAHDVLSEQPWIVYAGALQGRSLKPSDCGDHGAVVVEFEDDRITAVRRHVLHQMRFEQIAVSIDGIATTAELRDRVVDRAEDIADAAPGALVVVRCHLVGRGALSSDLLAPGWADGFALELRETADDRIVWESVAVDVNPEIPYEELRDSPGFAGDVVRAFAALGDDPDALAQLFADLEGEVPEGDARRERDHDARRELLERARDVALDELLRQEGGR